MKTRWLWFVAGLAVGVCGTLIFGGRYSAISVKTDRDKVIAVIYDRFSGRSMLIGEVTAREYFPQYMKGGRGPTDDLMDAMQERFRKPKLELEPIAEQTSTNSFESLIPK